MVLAAYRGLVVGRLALHDVVVEVDVGHDHLPVAAAGPHAAAYLFDRFAALLADPGLGGAGAARPAAPPPPPPPTAPEGAA